MPDAIAKPPRNSSWSRTLVRATLICAGSVGILLPAWLPNRPSVPIESGTVELLQAFLLAAAAAVMLGASPHAGHHRPICRVLALGLIAAFVGEIEAGFDLGAQVEQLIAPAVDALGKAAFEAGQGLVALVFRLGLEQVANELVQALSAASRQGAGPFRELLADG